MSNTPPPTGKRETKEKRSRISCDTIKNILADKITTGRRKDFKSMLGP